MNLEELSEDCMTIAIEAGHAILEIYKQDDLGVEIKSDDSPLTLADKASHEVIMKGLSKFDYPILSEEGKEMSYDERKDWTTYWCVDPLDGTKEFINRNGEFTVNIALISDKKPVLGIIYVPVKDTIYIGIDGVGAKKGEDGILDPIKVKWKDGNRIAVRSKSHANPAEEEVLEKYNVTDAMSVGSSLKFCMVAEGKADVYYRHGPTMEWDTAAGQAVVEAAGGTVYKGNTEDELFTYNKENLLNGSFLVLGK
ncbi:3'(2'),5'-bisphosphate nucleotidase CysQ [Flammeovirga kamogawensis]|uniref:3'(2'),5'-bisphosphate nucleotidase CysQ n=1 Tax=Flammeovirga kamogawensis TaxID=373891 RepID=A0ABX8GVH1_9BACT|nr:3'(2'),5'-bisphosphate nucleotidase CysQ [Flammeovirga kamogawensis]MBB6461004.1 3'(2'), 5'-bisphosphate nucleotidase [Flammeovirga kamogawensis]QWG07576.1 3'(2'),5'-bisphosphate nucleotidase CysQ [Flammeovirga kamogawensis]TRX69388.1 3'(2'),5'-bisphosphate nucleotidase CysQ [Flammeovirga kamogawensis]